MRGAPDLASFEALGRGECPECPRFATELGQGAHLGRTGPPTVSGDRATAPVYVVGRGDAGRSAREGSCSSVETPKRSAGHGGYSSWHAGSSFGRGVLAETPQPW